MREIMERFSTYMEMKGLNDNQVTNDCGLSHGLLGQARRGKSDLGKKAVDKISSTYRDLNRVWLVTGEGEMLLTSQDTPREDNLEIFETYLLPMSAMGGSLIGFDTEGARLTDCEKVISPIAGADFAITVTGDSMYPKYPSGCRILIKQINPRAFIEWGKTYVLDTCNGIIIKEVQPSDAEDEILCHSINPSGRYKDFHVSLYDVRGMYRILASVRMD